MRAGRYLEHCASWSRSSRRACTGWRRCIRATTCSPAASGSPSSPGGPGSRRRCRRRSRAPAGDRRTRGAPTLFFDDDGALVGFGGFKGAPVDGDVEVGYAVAPSRQGRGIATAVVDGLVGRAGDAAVTTVIAHTLAEENPSTSVLRKSGFVRTAELDEPGLGAVWRWERPAGG